MPIRCGVVAAACCAAAWWGATDRSIVHWSRTSGSVTTHYLDYHNRWTGAIYYRELWERGGDVLHQSKRGRMTASHKEHGHWTGSLLLANGSTLSIDGLFG
ncbi:MAG: hypothetical protein AAF961_03600, partial [Planctomycetota bacterium]